AVLALARSSLHRRISNGTCCPCSTYSPPLPSFPTRRSSDLVGDVQRRDDGAGGGIHVLVEGLGNDVAGGVEDAQASVHVHQRGRSEEHTSELQSRFDLVCRLLLEKKNQDGEPTHPRATTQNA